MNSVPMCYDFYLHDYNHVVVKDDLGERVFLYCTQCGDTIELDQDEDEL